MTRVSLRTSGRPARGIQVLVAVAIAAVVGFASGHATVVFGTLSVDPNPPPTGTPFRFELTLDDPTGTPVEDAIVIAELTPMPTEDAVADVDPDVAPDTEPLVAVRFAEMQPGTYRAEATVPTPGPYQVFLRDQTFAQEEATQLLTMSIGTEQSVAPIDFLFPPTATGGGLNAWLLWLVAIPLIAGIVVTIVVLRSSPATPGASPDEEGAGAIGQRPTDRP